MSLREAVNEYLAIRRRLGFRLETQGRLLTSYAEYVTTRGGVFVTIQSALEWARSTSTSSESWTSHRLGIVRCFARYAQGLDQRHQVPPPDLVPAVKPRAVPYIYTDAEVAALMAAARRLPSPSRAATYSTYIGLLAATGMRAGEAIALDRDDVHWDEGVLTVRQGKFGKSRELVLHPTTVESLRAYDRLHRRLCRRPASPAFFRSGKGTRLIYKNVHFVFHELTKQVGLTPRSARCRPRPHDLRHTFAVSTLVRWYRDGADVQARLPALSTYLGHVDPADTYWYLSAAPELLGLAAQRLEAQLGWLA